MKEVTLEVLLAHALDGGERGSARRSELLDADALARARGGAFVDLVERTRQLAPGPTLAPQGARNAAVSEVELLEQRVLLELDDLLRELALGHLDPIGHAHTTHDGQTLAVGKGDFLALFH